MSDGIIATVNVEETDEGFFYVLEGKEPVGPYADEELASQAAIDFLQAAMTRLVEQTLTGK